MTEIYTEYQLGCENKTKCSILESGYILRVSRGHESDHRRTSVVFWEQRRLFPSREKASYAVKETKSKECLLSFPNAIFLLNHAVVYSEPSGLLYFSHSTLPPVDYSGYFRHSI